MRRRPGPGLFRTHALNRFVKRRPDLFRPSRTQPGLYDVLPLAQDSYLHGRMITRQEAREIVGGGLKQWRHGDYIFRAAGDGRGIWIARWSTGGERVQSYIISRRCRTWPYPCRIHLQRRRACA